ncbi:MAG TPA: hypothetical protein P5123_01085 [Spirochaetota bacterium]|nr:hypothetical protein [Spirochaetota bacterium]
MRKIYLSIIILLLPVFSVQSGTVTVTEGSYATPEITDTINEQMSEIAEDINEDSIIMLSGKQNNLAQATHNAAGGLFLNGSLFSAMDSRLGSVSIGFAAGAENPFVLEEFPNNIRQGYDKKSSFAVSAFTVDCNVNADNLPFIKIKGIVFNTKIGYFKADSLITDVKFDSFLFGVGARYKLFEIPVQNPFFQLRSLTAGTGIYYSSATLSFFSDTLEKEITADNGITTESSTDVSFQMDTYNVVTPIDLVTTANAFHFLNIIAGFGVDLNLGSSTLNADADIKTSSFDDQGNPITSDNPAKLNLTDSKTDDHGSYLRYKMIFGLGFEFGPGRIEIPAVFYPGNGWAASISIGASI